MIPVSRPALLEEDRAAALDALQSGWISSAGPYLDRFERAWADACSRKHGIAVSNGTAALEVALHVLATRAAKNGDTRREVVMPSFTIISCAIAAVRAGLEPVFVDVDPETWCIDVEQTRAAIGPLTLAVMPVHMYGHPADMQALLPLCAAQDVAIIEDAAEAHGAEVIGPGGSRRCGSFGTLSCFSFYANKLITTGEGGMVLTDDDDLAQHARSYRNLAFVPERRFLHPELAHNFRLTNVQAALAVPQIARFDRIVAAKRRQGERYQALLKGLRGVRVQAVRAWARPVFWMFAIMLEDDVPFDAAELARRLGRLDVETRPLFLGLHEQPMWRERAQALRVTERLARRGLYLPSSVDLTDAEQDATCDALARAMAEG
jgi:perosamine synthetase